MKKLLIRAEDKNIWERRAPLTPADLKTIIAQTNCEAYLENSPRRFFKDQEYSAIGAKVCQGMNEGEVILGIKEIPVEKLINNKIYIFFSHTIKGQKVNMPMLKRIMEGGSTLIDYEKITDSRGVRQVYFGNYAGDVGTLNILWLMGEYWEFQGIKTPFLKCKQALNYHSLEEAREHLREVGQLIKTHGLPKELGPLVIGILGYGNVSKGAQSILACLPVQRILVENLKEFIEGKSGNLNSVYLLIFEEKHLVQNQQGQKFDLQEYYQYPARYQSQFEQYLPYLSILINATYWDNRYPRFVSWEGLKKLYQQDKKPKLQGIADITCDINGSIECNVKTTNSGQPAYLCNPHTKTMTDGHKGEGIVLLAVDNLPAELPYDASVFFSNQLKRYLPNILEANYTIPLKQSGLNADLQKAVIVQNGELTESFKYLEQYL